MRCGFGKSTSHFRPDQSDGSGDGAQQPCRISPARRQRAGTICAIFARKDQKQAKTILGIKTGYIIEKI